VEPGAEVGEDTTIWHFAHVRSSARIGSSCIVGKDVYVDQGAVVGDRVKIQNGVSVYDGVTIENEVFVGPGVVFTNDRFPRAVNSDFEVVPTLVRHGASLGANSTIRCGIEVGSYAVVGAGSVVTRSVEPHQLVMGNPARPAGWMCRCGMVVSRDVSTPPVQMLCAECLGTT
jgi:acetyltransferase-like isoleucine patch superfamily enzyme